MIFSNEYFYLQAAPTRLLMEKRLFLNQSNTKWVALGIKPESKLLGEEATGFQFDIAIGGSKMPLMSLGGSNGFLNLCQGLQSFEELKFAYRGTVSDYDDIDTEVPLNISKKTFGGNLCFCIEAPSGDTAFLAITTAMEMLKMERIIVASSKTFTSLAADAEKRFNDFVAKAANDLAAVEKEVETMATSFSLKLPPISTIYLKNALKKQYATNQLLQWFHPILLVKESHP